MNQIIFEAINFIYCKLFALHMQMETVLEFDVTNNISPYDVVILFFFAGSCVCGCCEKIGSIVFVVNAYQRGNS